MEENDKNNSFFIKIYKGIRDQIIPPKKECPDQETLRKYTYGKLEEKEKEHIEGHLISCSECWEALEILRTIERIEHSSDKMPAILHKRAKQILHPITISLFWDQIRGKITQITPNIREKIIPKGGGWFVADSEFQIVRNSRFKKDSNIFPYKTLKKVKEGKIFIEIDRSEKENCLTLTVFFHPTPEKSITDMKVSLYKLGRIYSTLNLDERGRAFFHRIKEGEYQLQFLKDEELLEAIELSILTTKDE